MSQILFQNVTLFEITLILASAVPITALLAWLAGLALVLRGSSPGERAGILSAYGQCPPCKHSMPIRATSKDNGRVLPTPGSADTSRLMRQPGPECPVSNEVLGDRRCDQRIWQVW